MRTAISRDSTDRPLPIVVAANFTAEPLRPVLGYWLRTLSLDATLTFAPYNQLMTQVLDPDSPVSRNTDGVNVLLLRHDVFPETGPDASARARSAIDHFARALGGRARADGGSWIVACCPAAPPRRLTCDHAVEDRDAGDALDARLATALDETPGTRVIRAAEILQRYPVRECFDEATARLADVPYTPAFFGALATMVARAIHGMVTPARKAIVLDCDNTLWSGLCGEAWPTGVTIDPSRRVLQQFMLDQLHAGALLCLCSKNEEADVWRVFDQHPDMLLRREHIVASRINWTAKSENIRAIAEELDLDAGTFIFVDDDRVECAEVEARLPGVLTVQLPAAAEEIPSLLAHVWAFDRPRATDADRVRTAQYRLRRERERYRAEAPTIEEFVRALDVRVRIGAARESELARIAQLTLRTTQFNCTLRRRSEADLRRMSREPGHLLFAVHVSDRFGDYGLVGAILAIVRDAALELDTFLLSCRALGRRVEHEMLRALEEAAHARGLVVIRLRFVPGERNHIARAFLDACGPDWVAEGDRACPEYVRVCSPVACDGAAAGAACEGLP